MKTLLLLLISGCAMGQTSIKHLMAASDTKYMNVIREDDVGYAASWKYQNSPDTIHFYTNTSRYSIRQLVEYDGKYDCSYTHTSIVDTRNDSTVYYIHGSYVQLIHLDRPLLKNGNK